MAERNQQKSQGARPLPDPNSHDCMKHLTPCQTITSVYGGSVSEACRWKCRICGAIIG